MNSNTALVRSIYGWLSRFGVVAVCVWVFSALCCAQALYAPPKYDISDIFFADSLNGWAVGAQGERSTLFRTEDGGDSWQATPIHTRFYRLFFLNAHLGWALSAAMLNKNQIALQLYMTIDGGSTWSYMSTLNASHPTSGDIITDFLFVDAKNGWFVGASSSGVGLALQTTDGGRSIRNVTAISGKQSLSQIASVDSEKLWIFGKDAIFASLDRGKMWHTQLDGGHSSMGYVSGLMLKDGLGWAASDNGTIVKTANFGQSWKVVLQLDEGWFTDISFWSRNIGCAVGASKLLECTLDGGASWTRLSVLPTREIHGKDIYKRILFTSSSRCWALSEGGWLFRSDDDGISWHDVEFPGTAHQQPGY